MEMGNRGETLEVVKWIVINYEQLMLLTLPPPFYISIKQMTSLSICKIKGTDYEIKDKVIKM